MKFFDLEYENNISSKNIKKNISKVISQTDFINGDFVSKLEEKLSKFTNFKYCIGVSSGTDALLSAMMALDVDENTNVFLPSFTYTATAETVCLLKAKPIFVDVNYKDQLVNYNDLEDALKKYSKKNDILLAVELFGKPIPSAILKYFRNKFGIKVIVDGAQSLGCVHDKKFNDFCNIWCTSFYPSKTLGCFGDGGACLTNNLILSKKIKSIINHGKGSNKYQIKRVGLNARLDTIQAGILLAKFNNLNNKINFCRNIYNYYHDLLDKDFLISSNINNFSASLTSFVLKDNVKISNLDLKNYLGKKKIPTMIYYPISISEIKVYKKNSVVFSNKNSKKLTNKIISLPIHQNLNKKDIIYINNIIQEILNY
jgi:UDP-2-acetamido-2-deoxy-ribo-hexuluronate aminotransferase